MKKMTGIYTVSALITCSVLMTSCDDNETSDNFFVEDQVQQQDQGDQPVTPTGVFTSSSKAELSNEMSNLIGKRFSCDQKVTRSDCFSAARLILAIHKSDGGITSEANRVRVDSFNNINEKNLVTVDYRNNQDSMRRVFRNHLSRWSSPGTPPTDTSDNFDRLEQFLNDQLGLDLNCRVKFRPCQSAVNLVVRAFADVNRVKQVQRVVVENTQTPRLQNALLTVGPNTKLSVLKNLIRKGQVTPPTTTPIEQRLNRVRMEIKNLSGKSLICDSQTTKVQCVEIGLRIVSAYESGEVPSTRLRQFVATTKIGRITNTPATMEVRLNYTVQDIIKLLKAHHRRYQ